jgi:protein SCO1
VGAGQDLIPCYTSRMRPPLVVTVIVAVSAFAAAALLRHCAPQDRAEPPPVIGALADFRLTDQSGAPFGAAELRGRVWIANFVYTRCTSLCPLFTAKMAAVGARTARLGDRLRLVSFTVDPEYDTPPVLAAYAAQHHAAWTFLTGATADVQRTVVDGLKTVIERDPKAPDPGLSILHGKHFVLVDRELRIRGFYDSDDRAAVDRLVADASALAR